MGVRMLNKEKIQQDFCKGALDNIQNLINRMDMKAGIIMTVVGLLSAALYALLAVLIKGKYIIGAGFIFFLVVFYFCVMTYILWQTMRIFLVRHATFENHSQAPRMLFPLLILQHFKTEKEYAARAIKLTHEDIIADYANQIMECSNIYNLKIEPIDKAIKAMKYLSELWLFVIAIAIWQIYFFNTYSGLTNGIK